MGDRPLSQRDAGGIGPDAEASVGPRRVDVGADGVERPYTVRVARPLGSPEKGLGSACGGSITRGRPTGSLLLFLGPVTSKAGGVAAAAAEDDPVDRAAPQVAAPRRSPYAETRVSGLPSGPSVGVTPVL